MNPTVVAPAMPRPELSVIMPAYNEGPRIRDSILRTHRQLCKMTRSFEIVVVDDGSSDATGQILEEVATAAGAVKVVRLQPNCGKGEALRQGFYQSNGKLIFFLDADMDLPPEQMDIFLDIMRTDGADAVIGSKRHPRSRVDYPWHRLMISVVYFAIVRVLFGLPVRDTQTGLKLFRRELLEECMPRMLVKAFAYDLELLVIAHHLGYRVAEAPVIVEYHPKYGYIPGNVIFTTGQNTLAIFYRLHILQYYSQTPQLPHSPSR